MVKESPLFQQSMRNSFSYFSFRRSCLARLHVTASIGLFLTIGSVLSGEAGALNYSIYPYGITEGLPHNAARLITQTRDGYIWVATDSGLCRFDGVRFISYRSVTTPQLPDNMIRDLYEDQEGVLWIA